MPSLLPMFYSLNFPLFTGLPLKSFHLPPCPVALLLPSDNHRIPSQAWIGPFYNQPVLGLGAPGPTKNPISSDTRVHILRA